MQERHAVFFGSSRIIRRGSDHKELDILHHIQNFRKVFFRQMGPDIGVIVLNGNPADTVPFPGNLPAGQEHFCDPVSFCSCGRVRVPFHPRLAVLICDHVRRKRRKHSLRFRGQFDGALLYPDHHTAALKTFPGEHIIPDLI